MFAFAFNAASLKVLLNVNRGTFVAGLAGILISWPVSGFLPMCAGRAGLTLMNILPILPSATRSPRMTPSPTISNRSSKICLTSLRTRLFFSARYSIIDALVSLSGALVDALFAVLSPLCCSPA